MSSALRRSVLAGVTMMAFGVLWSAPAAACSVCYGASDSNGSPLLTAARLGVFLLLGVTVALLGGFAKFFFYLRNRARQAESESIAAEWAQLQRSASS
ncbi:MAG TPA: hypothetical protein VGS22_21185 [Thermoanaerobaculia bacterium]|jgi:hypothetical protein|nr:hypothetical protein [Thermoanaerobaculia bacterium]